MPQYSFMCKDCKREFTEFMHIADLDKRQVKCPHCGSEKVEQQLAGFFAQTSKKS